MSIDASFVEAIRKPTEAEIFKVEDGRMFSNVKLVNLPPPDQYDFPTIELRSLESLVDYLTSDTDTVVHPETIQIICNHDTVEVVSEPKGIERKRDTLVRANAGAQPYSFGHYQPLEDFRISLLTAFEANTNRDEILRFISNVNDEHIANSQDDGVSQTATVKTGLVSLGQVKVPSPVLLNPIRTFIEVEQPVGTFLFRMKNEKDRGLWCALFEIHTNWKFQAAVSVKEWLKVQSGMADFTILA